MKCFVTSFSFWLETQFAQFEVYFYISLQKQKKKTVAIKIYSLFFFLFENHFILKHLNVNYSEQKRVGSEEEKIINQIVQFIVAQNDYNDLRLKSFACKVA